MTVRVIVEREPPCFVADGSGAERLSPGGWRRRTPGLPGADRAWGESLVADCAGDGEGEKTQETV